VMGYNPSRFAYTLNHPVANVTWEMAMEFCQKLTTMESVSGMLPEGFVYRLPTEAEWE
ncbi:MAG TPA: formylglycine-generating enzyme family protein, partial [Verrucomicrobiales bacterium]|nr:formylglycine-generating enzyme family protein [Verrucomicrobiales bacterium]